MAPVLSGPKRSNVSVVSVGAAATIGFHPAVSRVSRIGMYCW